MTYRYLSYRPSGNVIFALQRAALGLSVITFIAAIVTTGLIFTFRWLKNVQGKRLKFAFIFFSLGSLSYTVVLALTVASGYSLNYGAFDTIFETQLAFNIIYSLFSPTAAVLLFAAVTYFSGVATHGEDRGKMRTAGLVLAVITELVVVTFFSFYAAAWGIERDGYSNIWTGSGLYILSWMRLSLMFILGVFAFVRAMMIPKGISQGRGEAIAASVMLVSYGTYYLALQISANVTASSLWQNSALASYVLDFVFGVWPVLAGLGIMAVAGKHLEGMVCSRTKVVCV